MLKTDCAKCIHRDLCKVRESRQQLLNMVADQLGPTFDLYCKEWKDKESFEGGRGGHGYALAPGTTSIFYADNRTAYTQASPDDLRIIHDHLLSQCCQRNPVKLGEWG